MSLAFTFRVPATALEGVSPEERESFLESLALKILEDATDRMFIDGLGSAMGGRRGGLMHRSRAHLAPRYGA